MPKAIINKLEDVTEGLRTEYRPGTAEEGLEGKFVLNVEGQDGWTLENVTGLKTALSTERGELTALKQQLKAFEGLDPAKARQAVTKMDELGTLDPKKDVDRLVEEKVNAQLGQLNERHSTELAAREKRIQARDELLRNTFQREAAIKAIAEEKGDVELLLPHVLPSIAFDLEESDSGIVPKIKVVDEKGNVRIGDSQGGNMTIEQRVKEMKSHEKFSRLFEGSGHQGTGDQQQPRKPGTGSSAKPLSQMTRKEKAHLIGEIGQVEFNRRANQEREASQQAV